MKLAKIEFLNFFVYQFGHNLKDKIDQSFAADNLISNFNKMYRVFNKKHLILNI